MIKRLRHPIPQGHHPRPVQLDFDLLAWVYASPIASPDQTASDPRLLTASDELLHLRFLVETDVGYRFSHESVRQTIYLRLSPLQRQRLHRQVALAMESLFPDQFELLAHHFAAAGERQPAVHYLTLAADRSRALLAHLVNWIHGVVKPGFAGTPPSAGWCGDRYTRRRPAAAGC